jgi:hypothetical protein
MRERDHLKDLGVGGIILIWILKLTLEDVDWSDVAQDRHKWQTVVNAVIKLQFP